MRLTITAIIMSGRGSLLQVPFNNERLKVYMKFNGNSPSLSLRSWNLNPLIDLFCFLLLLQ